MDRVIHFPPNFPANFLRFAYPGEGGGWEVHTIHFGRYVQLKVSDPYP